MNLNISSGKKFQDSLSFKEGFNVLKKKEMNRKIVIDILFVLFFLVVELGVFYIISR